MQEAKQNDRVIISYEGRLESGEVFASSPDLALRLGEKTLWPALELAIIGMRPGQSRTIGIPPEESFGLKREELVLKVPRANLAQREIKVGMTLALKMERDGQTHSLPATLISISHDEVEVDFNHPLAGQELFYTITLEAIESA